MKKRSGKSVVVPSSKYFFGILFLSILIFVLHAIFVFLPVLHNIIHLHNIIGNMFIVTLSFLALFSAFKIYKSLPHNFPRENKGNIFLLLSLLLMFIGDLFWLFSEVFLGSIMPMGSYPDLAWSLSYVMLIISIIYFILIGFRPSTKMLYWILIIGTLVGGFILYWDIAEDLAKGSFNFAHAIQDGYILFDVIVLLLIIYLIWPIIFSRFGLHWVILGFGIFIRLIYDRFFAQMSEDGIYYTGHPVDLLYVFFYVSVVIAFYIKSKDWGLINA